MTYPLSRLHPYQVRAIRHTLDHPHVALWLDMGLGKTIVTLCAMTDLFDRLKVYGALIVAPLRVCQAVWRQEAIAWEYTRHLTFRMISGNPKKRARALRTPAMIYLINYENLQWLLNELDANWFSRGKKPPFNLVVMDEISRLKSTRVNQGSVRGEAIRKINQYCPYRIGLTGTPASNGFLDLFGQYLVLDDGRRLGQSFSAYQAEYFYPVDYNRYRWRPFERSAGQIQSLIGDITLSMSNKDYLDLPPLRFNDIWVNLPPKARKIYDKAEKDFFVELDSGKTVDIATEASKVNRCLQMANGAIYLEPGAPEWEHIHDAKMDVLEEIMEEAAGAPVLLAYQFRHDADRIMKKYKNAVWLSAKLSEKKMLEVQDDWNEKKIPLMIGHPASIGHGLNLQAGSHILVWFGLSWSQDLYSQTIARLRRQGQTMPLTVHRIMTRDTVDVIQDEVLHVKQSDELSIREAVAKYRHQKRENPTVWEL